LTVRQNLEFWARVSLIPRSSRLPLIERALERFGLQELADRRSDRLSMGQRQRLRLALAFLHEPDVVLLDEPATSLDEDGLGLLGAAIDDLKERGGAAVVCLPSGWERLPAIDVTFSLAGGRLWPA
jgi:ABC-type multidrug transport system ATPase subunit